MVTMVNGTFKKGSLLKVLIFFHFKGYNTDLFCIPNHYVDAVGNVLIPYGKYFSESM